jgi:hypothetical protein
MWEIELLYYNSLLQSIKKRIGIIFHMLLKLIVDK